MISRQSRKILLTCILLGSWEFAWSAANAPQFGNAVNETMKVYLCPHQGGPAPWAGSDPLAPSVGVRVERSIILGDRVIYATPEYFCSVDGKITDQRWRCPDFSYMHSGGVPD